MPRFVLAYHGKPNIQSKEDGAAHMAAWNAWSEGLGEAVVDPGMPVGQSKTISVNGVEDGGGSNPISGITILEAATLDDAISMAKDCPHISGDGTIEVAEAMNLDM